LATRGRRSSRRSRTTCPRTSVGSGKGIAELIIRKHRPWLEEVIKARDRVNHLIGVPIRIEEFMVFEARSPDSPIIQIHRPRWSPDQTVREFMDVVWENLIRLFEDFVISCLMFRFKEGFVLFHGTTERSSPKSPWRVTTKAERDRTVSQPGWTELKL
jgi:hypothetical protein